MQLKSLLVASLVACTYGTTVQDVLNDIAALNNDWSQLDNATNAFPGTGGTLTQALVVHNDAGTLNDAIQASTAGAQNLELPVSADDATAVLAAYAGLQTNTNLTLTDLVSKKPAFDALGGNFSALILQDIQQLNASTTQAWALVGDAPSDVLPSAEQAKAEIAATFATAIAAFQAS